MPNDKEIYPAVGGNKNEFVQTYAEDMAKVIEDGKSEGIIKNIIHGAEENEKEKRKSSPDAKRNKLFMLLGFVLFVTGIILLVFFISKKESPTVPVEKQFTPLIFNDKSSFIETAGLSKDQVAQAVLAKTRGTTVKLGGVEGIYLTSNKKVLGLREFILLIKSSFIPGESIFVSDNFLMGVANNADKDFFLLMKVRSSADVFESLRLWESKMFFDLHRFFGVELTADAKYLLTKEFQDGVVENKNARILYDNNNQIIMMYVFANETSIIFSNTENAVHEVMLRLASSKIEK